MISRVNKREIVTNVILTIITCGIYGIVWFIIITDDCGNASGDRSISGGVAFLLTLITCGLYGLYWAYQMGKRVALAQEKRNLMVTDNSILYLILNLIGFSLITMILIQVDLNKLAEFDNGYLSA